MLNGYWPGAVAPAARGERSLTGPSSEVATDSCRGGGRNVGDSHELLTGGSTDDVMRALDACTRTHTHAYAHTNAGTHTRKYTHIRTHVHTYARMHTHTQSQLHTHTQSYTHTNLNQTHPPPRTHTHTRTHHDGARRQKDEDVIEERISAPLVGAPWSRAG